MSTTSRGNGFELEIANRLEDAGWLVASRRHRGGAGDLLAVHPDGRRWLIECKTTARSALADFGPAKRKEMRKACRRQGLGGWLVWRAPRGKTQWIPEAGWPLDKGEK